MTSQSDREWRHEKIRGFIEQFADNHAMPLPGRLPTHKDYQVMLLPSHMSKSSAYRWYIWACESEQTACVSQRTLEGALSVHSVYEASYRSVPHVSRILICWWKRSICQSQSNRNDCLMHSNTLIWLNCNSSTTMINVLLLRRVKLTAHQE